MTNNLKPGKSLSYEELMMAHESALDVWISAHADAAEEEGWGLFDANNGLEIQRIDDPPSPFEADEDVIDHCRRRAAEGSEMHRLALELVEPDGPIEDPCQSGLSR
jgi:hypothetical protein